MKPVVVAVEHGLRDRRMVSAGGRGAAGWKRAGSVPRRVQCQEQMSSLACAGS